MATSDNVSIYGKILPQKAKNIVNLKVKKDIGFKYPIEENSPRGYFSKQTGVDLIKNNLRQLLKTEPGERFMLPNYGCNLKKYLMEPLDEITFAQVKDTISNSIYKYLGKISILRLQVFETQTSQLLIKLSCVLRDEETVSFEFNFNV